MVKQTYLMKDREYVENNRSPFIVKTWLEKRKVLLYEGRKSRDKKRKEFTSVY